MKSKLFQTTKEFKEFKFQQNLRIEFTKNDKVFKNRIFADPWFDSEKIEFNDTNIDELLDIQHNQLSSRVERWTYEGPGWTINNTTLLYNLLFQKLLLVMESRIFHYPKN